MATINEALQLKLDILAQAHPDISQFVGRFRVANRQSTHNADLQPAEVAADCLAANPPYKYPPYSVRTLLILFLTIAISVLTSPAYGEDMSNQQYCNNAAIVAMVKEIEDIERQLRNGKSSRPREHIDPKEPRNVYIYIDVSDIARKYIRVDCELKKLRVDLVNAGFKITDSEVDDRPTFYAVINFKLSWFDFGSTKFRLKIEHELGRINLITGTIFYPGS